MNTILDAASIARAGGWLQTYTGKQVFPLDPAANVYDITDIAASLSNMTRYAGHCLRFYSVAEHCVLMARKAREIGHGDDICRAMLLHDASEAYLIDVPRPVKLVLAGYREIENRLMESISLQLGFAWPEPLIVKEFDNRILHDERAQAMAPSPHDWNLPGQPLGVTLQFWSPEEARAAFLAAARECGAAS